MLIKEIWRDSRDPRASLGHRILGGGWNSFSGPLFYAEHEYRIGFAWKCVSKFWRAFKNEYFRFRERHEQEWCLMNCISVVSWDKIVNIFCWISIYFIFSPVLNFFAILRFWVLDHWDIVQHLQKTPFLMKFRSFFLR